MNATALRPAPRTGLLALLAALAPLAAIAALAGCKGLDVRSDSSAAFSPGECHSFSWIDSPASQPSAFGNPLNDKRLHDAVSQRLQMHGMTMAAAETADCMASVYWEPDPPYAFREHRISVDLYRRGTGPAGREPLWHASVNLNLTQLTGAEAERRIRDVVGAMFTTFPTSYQPGGSPLPARARGTAGTRR